jgi:hypothetical protein
VAAYLKSTRPDRMNRRVADALAAHDFEREFHVYDAEGVHHGSFATRDEARGCVAFDGIQDALIVRGAWGLQ